MKGILILSEELKIKFKSDIKIFKYLLLEI